MPPSKKILRQVWERFSMRLLSYVILPNHWRLVVWPAASGALSAYLQWLTVTRVRRWHAHHQSVDTGPICRTQQFVAPRAPMPYNPSSRRNHNSGYLRPVLSQGE